MLIDRTVVRAFKELGAVVVRNAIPNLWIEKLQRGLERNIATPGPFTRCYTKDGESGSFIGDYCNWARIQEYKSFFFDSPAAALAADLMQSSKVNLFHEHVLVKEPNTENKTPWHHDQPYYCVNGNDTCSLWIPLDPISEEACVQFIAGSHLWGRWFTPTKFIGSQFENKDDGFEEMPDIDSNIQNYDILSWELNPGDCIAFNFLTVHGAPGNTSKTIRRRAFAARFTGDDVTYVKRKGEMSPPFPQLELREGEPIDCPTFPVLLRR
ncbi:MAG: phytanoyl-CoA dioxygenase [Rhodospirillaceae bacterium]|nr:phytanoyl-CoA dioxygenase [Rhodospirillaceae bacterium]|tara:strand:- start:2542 stop:3342 length:801 start_codon:yes stop_codon:yes gene_type:complete